MKLLNSLARCNRSGRNRMVFKWLKCYRCSKGKGISYICAHRHGGTLPFIPC